VERDAPKAGKAQAKISHALPIVESARTARRVVMLISIGFASMTTIE
jgi:hypothetical protein